MRCRAIAVALVGALVATGCAGAQHARNADMERLLAASGFQVRLAETPERAAHLQTLEQHQLVAREHDGQTYFFYADAEHCQCLYVGDEAAFQEFQRLATQEKIAEDQRKAAEAQQSAAMNWGIWGPWWW